jgi:DNA-binding IclR family transcriptional regulator
MALPTIAPSASGNSPTIGPRVIVRTRLVKRRGAGGDDGPDYTIDAVDTAFKLLRLIARGERPSSLIDLTAQADISRSTAFRMLWNLERVGMVRHEVDGGYVLGAAALDFGSAYGRQNPLVLLARTFVDGLRDRTNETCALLVRDGADRVCLHRADSQQEVRFTMRLGTAGPLWRGAAGRVLFAFLPQAERLAMVAQQPDGAALERDALAVFRAGFALSIRDTAPNVWSVAWPVHSREGVVAALACAGPTQRQDPDNVERCTRLTQSAANDMSAQLG